MKRFIYFNHTAVHRSGFSFAGQERFTAFFKLFDSASLPIDRTGTISLPFNTESLFPIPKLRPFSKTYEEICNERAAELLAQADRLARPLYVFWSGGIDSTLVLVSLLKHATHAQKENITVLMNEDSIMENPNFYRDHIYGKLKREPSIMFNYFLGTDNLFVNGEHNDQIFGAELIGGMMRRFGEDIAQKSYDRELFKTFFTEKTGAPALGEWYVEFFERIAAASPVKLLTNHDNVWWTNFNMHWQGVFARTLLYTAERNKDFITKEYLNRHYTTFYNTEDFQLWSMLNPDKKIKDTWRSYKWPAKDIIYGYTKDADYRDNKIKRGSFYIVLLHHIPFNYLDDSFHLMNECNLEEYYNPQNDFV